MIIYVHSNDSYKMTNLPLRSFPIDIAQSFDLYTGMASLKKDTEDTIRCDQDVIGARSDYFMSLVISLG